jgi:hypothetical protein
VDIVLPGGSDELASLDLFPIGENMFTNSNASPLEHLAAFAIVLVSAVVGTVAVGAYIDMIRSDPQS